MSRQASPLSVTSSSPVSPFTAAASPAAVAVDVPPGADEGHIDDEKLLSYHLAVKEISVKVQEEKSKQQQQQSDSAAASGIESVLDLYGDKKKKEQQTKKVQVLVPAKNDREVMEALSQAEDPAEAAEFEAALQSMFTKAILGEMLNKNNSGNDDSDDDDLDDEILWMEEEEFKKKEQEEEWRRQVREQQLRDEQEERERQQQPQQQQQHRRTSHNHEKEDHHEHHSHHHDKQSEAGDHKETNDDDDNSASAAVGSQHEVGSPTSLEHAPSLRYRHISPDRLKQRRVQLKKERQQRVQLVLAEALRLADEVDTTSLIIGGKNNDDAASVNESNVSNSSSSATKAAVSRTKAAHVSGILKLMFRDIEARQWRFETEKTILKHREHIMEEQRRLREQGRDGGAKGPTGASDSNNNKKKGGEGSEANVDNVLNQLVGVEGSQEASLNASYAASAASGASMRRRPGAAGGGGAAAGGRRRRRGRAAPTVFRPPPKPQAAEEANGEQQQQQGEGEQQQQEQQQEPEVKKKKSELAGDGPDLIGETNDEFLGSEDDEEEEEDGDYPSEQSPAGSPASVSSPAARALFAADRRASFGGAVSAAVTGAGGRGGSGVGTASLALGLLARQRGGAAARAAGAAGGAGDDKRNALGGAAGAADEDSREEGGVYTDLFYELRDMGTESKKKKDRETPAQIKALMEQFAAKEASRDELLADEGDDEYGFVRRRSSNSRGRRQSQQQQQHQHQHGDTSTTTLTKDGKRYSTVPSPKRALEAVNAIEEVERMYNKATRNLRTVTHKVPRVTTNMPAFVVGAESAEVDRAEFIQDLNDDKKRQIDENADYAHEDNMSTPMQRGNHIRRLRELARQKKLQDSRFRRRLQRLQEEMARQGKQTTLELEGYEFVKKRGNSPGAASGGEEDFSASGNSSPAGSHGGGVADSFGATKFSSGGSAPRGRSPAGSHGGAGPQQLDDEELPVVKQFRKRNQLAFGRKAASPHVGPDSLFYKVEKLEQEKKEQQRKLEAKNTISGSSSSKKKQQQQQSKSGVSNDVARGAHLPPLNSGGWWDEHKKDAEQPHEEYENPFASAALPAATLSASDAPPAAQTPPPKQQQQQKQKQPQQRGGLGGGRTPTPSSKQQQRSTPGATPGGGGRSTPQVKSTRQQQQQQSPSTMAKTPPSASRPRHDYSLLAKPVDRRFVKM